MSKRAGKGSPSSSPLVGVVLLVVIAAGLWFYWQQRASTRRPPSTAPVAATPVDTNAPLIVSKDRIDPANEGRMLDVSGTLRAATPAHDVQLGITADAVMLLRKVEMLQWREHCAVSACDYALVWSEQAIDSGAFRERKGHDNATRFPFTSARFVSEDLRLGAFKVDAMLAAASIEGPQATAWPVHAKQLPPNLAATFRERDGVLYAGADPDKPAAGDLRVSYRIVATGVRRLTGVQHGDRLQAVPKQ